ncbi:DNA methyltransferase [Magnetovibrio sp.]|uniref:DNA methyltransferase n=1 Tax=Magnetovibrio sp. TaxID=2024836 RepID=UPI002F932C6D
MAKAPKNHHLKTSKDALYRDFFYPPFSTLDARSGWWQARKRQWLAIGLQSERGRGNAFTSISSAWQAQQGKPNSSKTPIESAPSWVTTSIFDPVLCELMYRWFVPRGGLVFDPFAGGSVRGIVAAKLGLEYIGFDIRAEQIKANQAQAKALLNRDSPKPIWKEKDACARSIYQSLRKRPDFLFTCPPYGDLEVYSDHPDDISAMPWDTFAGALTHSIKQASARLADNRFAAFVVSDIRDKKGNYRGLPDVVRAAFKDAGLGYHSEAVLINALGTVPIRSRGYFENDRKLARAHQNVLLFVKGCPKKAKDDIGDVPCDDTLLSIGRT